MLGAILALTGLMPAGAGAQVPPRLVLVDTAVIRSPRLTESSGVAVSASARGVLWSHNDGGNEPRLYATDSAGHDLGSIVVEGAKNVDWEDLGSGPCPRRGGPCLYLADIGDNRRRRNHVVIYRLAEPEPPRGPADTLRTVRVESATRLRYPDHPHDAEAVAVVSAGPILVITKERSRRPLVFRAPMRDGPQRPGEVDTLQRVGQLELVPSAPRLRLVTGAAVSTDGRVLVVRTYSSLHFFRLRGDSLPIPITPVTGLTIPFVEPQGEAVAFLGPDLLVLTSERDGADHATITRVRVVGLPGSGRRGTP